MQNGFLLFFKELFCKSIIFNRGICNVGQFFSKLLQIQHHGDAFPPSRNISNRQDQRFVRHGLFVTAVVSIALTGWIFERWGGRVWVPALAGLSMQLPYLLGFPHYRTGLILGSDDDLWLVTVAGTFNWLGPLILLAVMTRVAPRLGLPPLDRPV